MRPRPEDRLPRRQVAELAANITGAALHGGSVPVTGMTQDSVAVRPGDLFAALPGARRHGAQYAAQAVRAGAVAVATDAAGHWAAALTGVPVIVLPDAAMSIGVLASALHCHPSSGLDVVGVTGTDGKTTTTWLIAAALEAADVPTGIIGSLDTRFGGRVVVADEPQCRRTTPEAADLQATLGLLRDRGARAVAMEASSHGLALGRTAGVRFAVSVFTNLGHEHLDFHGDMDTYFEAKAALFTTCDHAVINIDDVYGAQLARRIRLTGRPVTTVSIADAGASWRATNIVTGRFGTTFTAMGPGHHSVAVRIALPGRFNAANAVAALATAVTLGVPATVAAAGMAELTGVPGRMEIVDGGDVTAVIDYAHTPTALTALLTAARTAAPPPSRVLLVFGTGGDRNASKRVLMGAAAARGADMIVITDDNPRHEDPAAIRAALRSGVEMASQVRTEVHEIPDRSEAIEFAAAVAYPGDVIVVAGKGPDLIQLIGDEVLSTDDPATLRHALLRRRRIAS